MQRLTAENELLRRENVDLRNKLALSSDSEDSESDSSDTCSSCSSRASSSDGCDEKPGAEDDDDEEGGDNVDYAQTNGHSPVHLQPV